MKYTISYTNRFKKDIKNCSKKGLNLSLLHSIISQLAETGCVSALYHPHKLKGKYKGLWECHIRPDWLLIWQQNDSELTLLFTNTGTHAELF